MVKLYSTDFMQFAPKVIGEQIHVNHEGCSAGLDTKKRLYIKRVAGGVLAYCHHCSLHGAYFNPAEADSHALRKWVKTAGEEGDITRVTRTHGDDVPTYHHITDFTLTQYLRKYHVNTTSFHFREVQDDHNLFMPIYDCDEDGTMIGYQIRTMPPNKGPKYLTTYFNNKAEQAWFINIDREHPPTELVITEDMISGYRIMNDTPADAMALLKTSLSKQAEANLKDYLVMRGSIRAISIWLDPDDAGQKGADKLYRRLKFLFPSLCIHLCHSLKEPKHLTPAELRAEFD